jgi:precorrin-2 dehydrogenase/sirohydrochlorin ferrochelatase
MHAMEMFPIFFKLDGRRCLVVGAGTIAAPKIESLLRAGGSVTVVAPDALPEVKAKVASSQLEWHPREFAPADLDGMFLVIAGTNHQAINHQVAEAARAKNVLCNSVDDPPDCDFFYPSVVRRGDLQIAISTAGKSPALAQRLRREIDALLPEDTGQWLDQLGDTRLKMLEVFPISQGRKEALHQLAQREHCEPADCPVQQTLDRMIASAVSESKAPQS